MVNLTFAIHTRTKVLEGFKHKRIVINQENRRKGGVAHGRLGVNA
jgi:hypothetical protein